MQIRIARTAAKLVDKEGYSYVFRVDALDVLNDVLKNLERWRLLDQLPLPCDDDELEDIF